MSSNQYNEHLLEVRTLMEETVQRLGDTSVANTWLLTPVSPGGKKPLDYLKESDSTTLRGFLLRTPTGREVFHPLVSSNRVHKERSKEELEDVLERLKPRAWIDDEEDGTWIQMIKNSVRRFLIQIECLSCVNLIVGKNNMGKFSSQSSLISRLSYSS